VTPEEFLAQQPVGLAAYRWIVAQRDELGLADVRVGRSQVAFWRRHAFAYLWLPGQYLARHDADVVLSLALRHEIPSRRWKEVVEPVPGRWTHHLELHDTSDLDEEVRRWLRMAAADAD
jgi:Domain of unknown function (DUF5655)